MSDESVIVKQVMIEASRLGARLFRNNRGMFLTIDGLRKVKAGLEAEGASDCIGFTPVTITADMVGQTIAVFTAAEVKKSTWKRPSTETEMKQQNFINFVNKNGGIGFFINCAENLKKELAIRFKNE